MLAKFKAVVVGNTATVTSMCGGIGNTSISMFSRYGYMTVLRPQWNCTYH